MERRVNAATRWRNGTGAGAAGLTLVACGALARELLAIGEGLPKGAFEITCLPASWHNHPERIVPGLRRKLAALRARGRNVAIVYGDCGTGGEIDKFCQSEGVERIPGPHCYEMFMGEAHFEREMEREIGTFFLTDYMVRHFERIVMKGMGIRKHPELLEMYFGNYKRALYIAQVRDADLERRAREAAAALGLAYEYRFTGYGNFLDWVGNAAASGGARNAGPAAAHAMPATAEVTPADTMPTYAKPAHTKRVYAKRADAKPAHVKRVDTKQADARMSDNRASGAPATGD